MAWTCNNCETAIEQQFQKCWNCGADLAGLPDSGFQHADGYEPPPPVRAKFDCKGVRLAMRLYLPVISVCFMSIVGILWRLTAEPGNGLTARAFTAIALIAVIMVFGLVTTLMIECLAVAAIKLMRIWVIHYRTRR
jgi:hypothetical protein